MLSVSIEGTTARLGKSQGYNGLSVRQDTFDGVVGMTSAWEPTPEELSRLLKGAKVHVSFLGVSLEPGTQPPVKVEVGEIPTGLSELNKPLMVSEHAFTYAFQDESNTAGARLIDIAYSAFMLAKGTNDEDGGPTDWFTDTRPMVVEKLATVKQNIETGGFRF